MTVNLILYFCYRDKSINGFVCTGIRSHSIDKQPTSYSHSFDRTPIRNNFKWFSVAIRWPNKTNAAACASQNIEIQTNVVNIQRFVPVRLPNQRMCGLCGIRLSSWVGDTATAAHMYKHFVFLVWLWSESGSQRPNQTGLSIFGKLHLHSSCAGAPPPISAMLTDHKHLVGSIKAHRANRHRNPHFHTNPIPLPLTPNTKSQKLGKSFSMNHKTRIISVVIYWRLTHVLTVDAWPVVAVAAFFSL